MCLARKASNGSTPCLPTSTRQSKPEAFSTSVFKWVRRSGPMDTQKRARVSFQPRRALLQPTISERAFAWPPPSCRSAELPVLSPTCKQNGWDVATTCSTTIAATLLTLCASVWALATFQNGHTVTWWIVLFCRACGVIASFVDFVVPSPLVSYLFLVFLLASLLPCLRMQPWYPTACWLLICFMDLLIVLRFCKLWQQYCQARRAFSVSAMFADRLLPPKAGPPPLQWTTIWRCSLGRSNF